MVERISFIPTRVRNMTKGGHVAGAEDIVDDVLNKTQDEINSETNTALERIEEKTDDNREEINRKQFDVGAAEFDIAPTEDSEKLVRSGAIYDFVKGQGFGQVVMPEGSVSAELQPNKLYIFGEVETLTIGFNAGEADGNVKEYMFQFTCPAAVDTVLTFVPSSVVIRWAGDELYPEAGMTYQVSIINNLGVYAEWEAVEE